MADPGGPQSRGLCFLSTLLSQKVPERSDTVLRCMIAGQPKPDVTWYKNGQTIDQCEVTSSYEFSQNQYIHILHLYSCTPKDTAVYQVSAKNHFGMICCSASVEVEGSSETPKPPLIPGDAGATGCQCESRTDQDGANQSGETEQVTKEEENVSLRPHTPAESPSSPSTSSCSPWFWLSSNISAANSRKSPDVKGTRRGGETGDLEDTEEPADGELVSHLSHHSGEQEVYSQGTAVSGLIDGASQQVGPKDDTVKPGHPNPRGEKYISFSLPLPGGSGDRTSSKVQSLASSNASDSNYELCPEITLTCTEEFSDDDLEYLECSDVMTDYSNAAWQWRLQGPEQVFLLESNDNEERTFAEHCLGGGECFLTEMGRGPTVSGDMGPVDATSGSYGHRSQPQEVQAESSQASTSSSSSLHAGMTLALGPQQDDMSAVTGPRRYKLPTPPPQASGNDSPGISGESGASHYHQAREESASDSLLNMATAVPTEGEVKPGDLGNSGRNQALEIDTKDSLSKWGLEKAPREKRLGLKGKSRKPREGAPQSSLNLWGPRGAAKCPLTPSDKTECLHAKTEATTYATSRGRAGEGGAIPKRKALRMPLDSHPQKGDSNWEGQEKAPNLQEAIQFPDVSDHLQVQMPDMGRETASHSQTPAFSESSGDDSICTGTGTNSLPSLGGFLEEKASLAQHLEVESYAGDLWHEAHQDWGHNTPGSSREDAGHELSVPETSDATMSSCEVWTGLLMEDSTEDGEPKVLHTVSLEPQDTIFALETVNPGPVDGEMPCVMWDLEAGGQGTSETMESLTGASVDKYLPQEVCFTGSELEECQSQVSLLCPAGDGTLGLPFQTGSSELPQTSYQSSEETDYTESPLSSPTVNWNVSPEASEGVTGEKGTKVENSTSTLASMVEADLKGLSLAFPRGLDDSQPPYSKNSFPVPFQEGDEGTSSAQETTDMLASQIPKVTFSQKVPMPTTAHFECFQVSEESEDMSTVTQVHVTKYLPISIAINSPAGDPEENSSPAQEENGFQLPSGVPLAPISNSSSIDATKEQICLTPSEPGVQVQVPLLPEGDRFCNVPFCQTENQPGDENQDRADSSGPEGTVQEKGRGSAQRDTQESLPHLSALPESAFQEHLPTTSAAQNETEPVPLGHSAAHLEETGSSDVGTSASVVAPSPVPSVSDIPPEQSRGSGPGHWGVGSKLKIITLEAPISESWSPRLAESEYKEPKAGPTPPGRGWAVSGFLQVGATWPELGSPGLAALAHSPPAGSESALTNSRKKHEGEKLVGGACWHNISSQFLSQPGLLKSSVDPVGEKENGKDPSQYPEESHLKVALPASFRQLPSCPGILESSVDPIGEVGVMEWARAPSPEPSEPIAEVIMEESEWKDGSLGQQVEVQPTILPAPCPQQSRETILSISQNQEDSEAGETEPSQGNKAKEQPATLHSPSPVEGEEIIPRERSGNLLWEGREGIFQKAEQTQDNRAEVILPILPHSGCLAVTSSAPVQADTHKVTGQRHEDDSVEPRHHQSSCSDSKDEPGKHLPSSGGLPGLPFYSSPKRNITVCSISHRSQKHTTEGSQIGAIKSPNASGTPAVTLGFISGLREAPERAQSPHAQGSMLGSRTRTGVEGECDHKAGSEAVRKKPETLGSDHVAEGIKKKILSRVAALRLKLEEKENLRKNSIFLKKIPKLEMPASHTEEKKEAKKPPGKREGKAPVLMKKIQAEMFPEHPGNVKLSCQFAEIHEDSTIWWTKDSKSVAQVQRSAGDNSTVSLAITQASQKDQGIYHCCLKNSYGKVSAEFNLTAEVLKQLSSHPDVKGCEEIEFSQLIFREDFLNDSYFGDRLRGQIATEALHFGEGVHRKAFRSRVMRGLTPVFKPGHACVLKVHNAVAYGTRSNDELVQRNYKLATQECYVQNTARHYAKIYAAEAQPLEGFGEVPEIIPIFLIHRPENNIPYATVEEELIGEFVKYSMRDGKEINFLRRESEAGQKCCTFQHWVYQKTSGCLLVTDMQGVGMKLTDVGIATLAKGYKGFKGNCSMSFIDQFKAIHQCNKYCQMLGLKSLQTNSQKQRKPSVGKSKIQPNAAPAKKLAPGTLAEKKA
ncbi:alpha-protein kinase 2 [Erinaceus europaeus]|uniref:non-specific serine/threonine protein kinase n=1 Tax=Erinaceus europaeus TaxID=9365 RepID=A0ABM3W016_ERIEU|nr:alpha-protein kinase 2 [Erinaceus europaeus]